MTEDNEKTHVLIVEDEPELAQLLKEYLVSQNYDSTIISNGSEVEPWLKNNATQLILLDIMLPGKDGFELCKDIRKSSAIPIVMVTAKVEEIDKLLGLELGADDYICKPYSPREVVARVKAVLRRYHPSPDNAVAIQVDEKAHKVTVGERAVSLTSIEFRLFHLLHTEPGRIFSRQYIMDNIYTDYRIVSDRTVDSHIKKLRKKLQGVSPDHDLIHSVYGAGYKLEFP